VLIGTSVTGAVLLSAAAALGFGTFGNVRTLPTMGAVYQAGIGDLNGDGKADIAAATDGMPLSDGATVFLGKGDGTFKAPHLYPVGADPDGIVIAKLNAGARPDLAVGNYGDSTLSILYGKKAGGFKTGPVLAGGPGLFLLASGDMNRDGRTDVVAGNYSSDGTDAVSVFLQKAGGGFKARQDYAASGGSDSIVVGRINGDKNLDVVNQDGAGTVSVLLGRPNGTLKAPLDKSAGTGGSGYENLAIADFNRDGKPDVAAAQYDDDQIAMLIGKGDGTFKAPKFTDVSPLGPNGIEAGDFNRDGKPDLGVAGYDTNEIHVLIGKGDGTFKDNPKGYPASDRSESLAAGRLNGDKGLDLAEGTDSSVDVFINKKH
jgi:hypothetical protein